MIRGRQVLAFVMAGGEGSRLHPLTAHRCKPSVPFNGKHRIVDFVLSNLVNSDICAIYLLVQYKSQALIEHVRQSWTMSRVMAHQFVTVVPPQMHHGPHWFQGTADSVAQNLHLIESLRPDVVAVFGADHIYRMDVRQMLDFHLQTRADATVATLPVPIEDCGGFGIVQTDAEHRITGFREKPRVATAMPGLATHALASMGNYLFETDALIEALRRSHVEGETDFGKHVLPAMIGSQRVMAYDFSTNRIPGLQPCEEVGYWRDVGTIDAYFEAHFDTLGIAPKFRMTNTQWPIYASPDQGESAQIESGTVRRSSIGAGSIVEQAHLDHAMLRREVRVEPGARVEHSIVMERSVIGQGVQLRRAIIDQDNHIPPGERIGLDLDRDRARFHVSEGGVVVVPRAHFAATSQRASRRAPPRDEPMPALLR